ncbi:IS607 family transposase [Pseudonocardia sp. ICBG1142]|uniref:IS607 family transposase n=1 Tax=Pseudonocardia sp. ICBG1142 TaxID=2846760 RepID=UPI001CF6AD3C|nr:IS607 family transposase [Pseudonocardia sp. ICBG1142]
MKASPTDSPSRSRPDPGFRTAPCFVGRCWSFLARLLLVSEDWWSAGTTARYLGVSTRTLRRYTERGTLPDNRSPGGRRVFLRQHVETLAVDRNRRAAVSGVVAYARVSSRRQQAEGDLDRQAVRLRAAASEHGDLVEVFTDVASGLSDRRPGLKRALTACRGTRVGTLLVTHPDRLSRFGTGLFEHVLAGQGTRVVYIGEDEVSGGSAEAELVRDMIAIVASFAGRLYGQRSAKARRLAAVVTAETGVGRDGL